MSPVPGGSLYGVVELDATLKNTITSLETATCELKKLATLDFDYKMPGLSAFRTDTEHMTLMLHEVRNKVEDALNERRNESQIIMNPDMSTTSSSNTSAGTTTVYSTTSIATTAVISSSSSPAPSPSQPSPPVPTVVYDFVAKIKFTK